MTTVCERGFLHLAPRRSKQESHLAAATSWIRCAAKAVRRASPSAAWQRMDTPLTFARAPAKSSTGRPTPTSLRATLTAPANSSPRPTPSVLLRSPLWCSGRSFTERRDLSTSAARIGAPNRPTIRATRGSGREPALRGRHQRRAVSSTPASRQEPGRIETPASSPRADLV